MKNVIDISKNFKLIIIQEEDPQVGLVTLRYRDEIEASITDFRISLLKEKEEFEYIIKKAHDLRIKPLMLMFDDLMERSVAEIPYSSTFMIIELLKQLVRRSELIVKEHVNGKYYTYVIKNLKIITNG